MPDVVVAGGGIVGLAVAHRLATEGAQVVVCDPAPGAGSSWAAAGMLAPVTEAEPTNPALARLGLASLERWPALASELGVDLGAGTLAVATDDDDRRALDELASLHRDLGLASARVTGQEARRLEPCLGRVRSGLDVPGDRSVDPRRVVAALLARLGPSVRRARVVGLRPGGGVRTDDGDVAADVVVVAAGASSPDLGVPAVPVRPVKGQIMRLHAPAEQLPTRTIRALVHGSPVYLVPRPSGELVVGATMEELGWDATVTAGALHRLLRDAVEVLPGITEMAFSEVVARHRPATPDNGPVIGWAPVDGVLVAAGHHRNGVLLAPITADAVAALVRGAEPPVDVAPWGPGRFA